MCAAGRRRPDPVKVLDARELEALDFGYRERLSDTHLPQIRDLPNQLPRLFAEAAGRARLAGFDGSAPLRTCLHDGVIHFAHKLPRR